LIQHRPSPLLGIVVVIPCHDEDFLLLSLLSLRRCDRPGCDVEVIVLINHAEDAPVAVREKNRQTAEQARRFAQDNNLPHLRFYVLEEELPRRHAGVGLARKIGMDEACYRFEKIGRPRGIIACFDADSRCEKSYLKALEAHFQRHPLARACSIYFEHPLSGPDFDERIYDAIAHYELHLRYYVHAQRWAGFPHAWQTIGSSMAVRCDAYQQQGGMNRRQAGEDFYFLHKFIPLGHFSEITQTCVIPSPRPSHRVPFGTGKAVGELVASAGVCRTYHPRSFEDLRLFFSEKIQLLIAGKQAVDIYPELPESLVTFLAAVAFPEHLSEIRANTSAPAAFLKRFWQWFDAFMVMKFVHHARDHFQPDLEVTEAAAWLLERLGTAVPGGGDACGLLKIYRKMDREGWGIR
jgi:hypothetical protein